MNLLLKYPDTATFILADSGEYSGNKTIGDQAEVPVIFVQGTNYNRNNHQDIVDADAVCWPDFTNAFIIEHANRLEGMYVLMDLYGGDPGNAWFKIASVVTHRDHLLNNTIDNIECRLQKTTPIPNIS